MQNMINFDNSATTFPKPQKVKYAVNSAIVRYGGNPGRSGHKLSIEAANQVYKVRESVANFFGAETENVAFTPNCTFSLNMAIKGIMQFGGHIIISEYEHNAVARPVHTLHEMRGIEYSIAEISDDDDETISNFEKLITSKTKCICCTIASNVTGRILPYQKIGELCKKYGLCFIADGAQACGILDLSMSDGFNFLCTAGHKSLYGPTGTGLLISDGKYSLSTIIEGGTGTTSDELNQPTFMPERLESGTINTVGILGLGEGIKFVKQKTAKRIHEYETQLCEQFINGISNLNNIIIYRTNSKYTPIVAFNMVNINSQEVANYLSEKGFALRGGLQCAGLTHQTLGTLEQGVVRFSPSAFNNKKQVSQLIYTLKNFKQ